MCRTTLSFTIEIWDYFSPHKWGKCEKITCKKTFFFSRFCKSISHPYLYILSDKLCHFLHIQCEFTKHFLDSRIQSWKYGDNIMSDAISLVSSVIIWAVSSISDGIFLLVGVYDFFWCEKKRTKNMSRNHRHSWKSSQFCSLGKIDNNRFYLIILMMGCEDVCSIIKSLHLFEKSISLCSGWGFDTHFLGLCKSTNIHFFHFTGDIFLIAYIRNKLSIPIRFISTKRMIEVSHEDFIMWVIFRNKIQKDHTIYSSTYREDKSIFWCYILMEFFFKWLHTPIILRNLKITKNSEISPPNWKNLVTFSNIDFPDKWEKIIIRGKHIEHFFSAFFAFLPDHIPLAFFIISSYWDHEPMTFWESITREKIVYMFWNETIRAVISRRTFWMMTHIQSTIFTYKWLVSHNKSHNGWL